MKLFQNSFVLFLKAFPLDLVKTFVLRASGSEIVFVKKNLTMIKIVLTKKINQAIPKQIKYIFTHIQTCIGWVALV